VASRGRADKFIDNAANSVLKILLVTAQLLLCQEHKSKVFAQQTRTAHTPPRFSVEV
jgi:hypothetical protein